MIPEVPARAELPDRIDSRAWLQLAEAKRRWGVSLAALLRRCRDLDKIDADEYRNAMKYMSARGWRTQEPGDRELGPAEAPLLVERALRVLEVEHGISATELIHEAHLPVADTTELIVGAKDRRPVVEF